MKKLNFSAFAVLTIALIFSSCEKEPTVVTFPSQAGPIMTSQTQGFFEENIKNETEKWNVIPDSTYQTLVTSNNYFVRFNHNTFTYSNGQAIVGDFTVEIVDVLTKKDMLKLNRPTFTNDGELLVSGGVIYLNAHQNGQQLSINNNAPVMVSIPTDEGTPMKYFNGIVAGNNDFGWDESLEDEVTIFTPNDTSWIGNNNSLSYNFTMDSFGWINCDFFYNSTTPLTGVNVILPEKHNGSNTYVFIYYSDINSVANMDDYNFDSNFDLGTGYSTPVGLDVTFVTISEVNDTFYYDLTNTAIIDNHLEEIDSLTIASESQIQNILNNLP